MSQPRLVIAADHGGFRLAVSLVKRLNDVAVISFVTPSVRPADDYPTVAHTLVQAMRRRPSSFGLGLCRSGVGLAIVANKHRGIRAAQATSVRMAKKSRQDENTNVLSLGADYLTEAEAAAIVRNWLRTPYRRQARFARRLREMARYEKNIRN